MDIGHPHFWTDGSGSNPAAFTTMTSEDVRNGRWLPVQEDLTVSLCLKAACGRRAVQSFVLDDALIRDSHTGYIVGAGL